MRQYGLQFIRTVSDLHLDMDVNASKFPWTPPGLPTDHLTALVIPGDIWHARKYLSYANQSWLAKRAQTFRYVVFVLGNHDYWGGALNFEADRVRALIKEQGLTNVFLLERDALVLEDVKFVGGTLWTDFNKQDPTTKFMWSQTMIPDSKYIKYRIAFTRQNNETVEEYRRLRYDEVLKAHLDTRSYIFQHAKKDQNTRKLVVVTHMAPSCLSIADEFKDDKIANGYYYTELGNTIVDTQIDYWFHGHMHNSVDYMIGNTRVINNPRGYEGSFKNDQFNPELLIEL